MRGLMREKKLGNKNVKRRTLAERRAAGRSDQRLRRRAAPGCVGRYVGDYGVVGGVVSPQSLPASTRTG